MWELCFFSFFLSVASASHVRPTVEKDTRLPDKHTWKHHSSLARGSSELQAVLFSC